MIGGARHRALLVATAGLGVMFLGVAPMIEAQVPALPNDRLAGLQWTFVRIRYHSWSEEGRGGPRMSYWEDPWAIDGPAAEQDASCAGATQSSTAFRRWRWSRSE